MSPILKPDVTIVAEDGGFQRLFRLSRPPLWKESLKEAYQKTWENGVVPIKCVKLFFVGRGGAGKTSCVRALLGKQHLNHHESTRGYELTVTHSVEWAETTSVESVNWDDAWERATHDGFFGRTGELGLNDFLRNGDLVRQKQVLSILSAGRDESVTPDLFQKPRKKRTIDCKEWENKTDGASSPTSVSMHTTCSIFDLGGQEEFAAMHQLFLSDYGVFLVVFSLEGLANEDTRKEEITSLRFWLQSIRLQARKAAVVLVGTRMAKLSLEGLIGLDAILRNNLKAEIDNVLTELNWEQELCFFPVENSFRSANRAANIRSTLNGLLEDSNLLPQTVAPVPVRWLWVLDSLTNPSDDIKSIFFDREATQETEHSTGGEGGHEKRLMEAWPPHYWSINDVASLAKVVGVEGEEVATMLCFFQVVGFPIIYFDSTAVLASNIVTDPQWLLAKLSKIICNKTLHTGDEEFEMRKQGLATDYSSLRDSGIASRSVLSALWAEGNHNIEYLVHVMDETLLACLWGADGSLLIPSLLPSAPQEIRARELHEFAGGALCWLSFNYMTLGFHQRLTCMIVEEFQALVDEDCVFSDLVCLRLGETPVLIDTDNTSCVRFRFHKSATLIPKVIGKLLEMAASVGRGFHQRGDGDIQFDLVLSSDGSSDLDKCALYSSVESASSLVKGMLPMSTLDRSLFDQFFYKRNTNSSGITPMPVEAKPRDVFLSHTGQDMLASVFAGLLAEHLMNRYNIEAFLDSAVLTPGDFWKQVIEDNARGCHLFVCIISKNYFSRYWCLHELDLAFLSGCVVVPVFFEGKIPRVDDAFREKTQALLKRKLGSANPSMLARWCENIEHLDAIQGMRNYSTHKHSMVEFRTEVSALISERLRKHSGTLKSRSTQN